MECTDYADKIKGKSARARGLAFGHVDVSRMLALKTAFGEFGYAGCSPPWRSLFSTQKMKAEAPTINAAPGQNQTDGT
jgi:hypothetical protein